MKKLLATVCLLNVGVPMVHAEDWSGAYGALGVSSINGGVQDFSNGAPSSSSDLDGDLTTLAVGYNLQKGSLVYGGEIAFSSGNTTFPDFPSFPDGNFLDGMIDLKGRVGYAAGKMLWYGTIGYSRTDRTFAGPVTNDPIKLDGMSFGLGVDVMISDRLTAGLEFQQRNLSNDEGEIGGYPAISNDYEVRTVGVRIGYRF